MKPPKAIPPTGQGGIDDAAPAPLPAEPTVRLPYLAQQESVPQADASESVEPMGTDVQSGPALPQERAAVEQLENSGSVAAPAPAPEPFPAQAGAAAALSPAPQPAARAEAHPMPQAVPMAAQESSDATTKMKRPPAARMVPPPTASAVAPGQETAPAFSSARAWASARPQPRRLKGRNRWWRRFAGCCGRGDRRRRGRHWRNSGGLIRGLPCRRT